MFVGHWSSAVVDVVYLIFHMTSQDHVIEVSCNFLSESSSFCVPTLPSLVVIKIVLVEIQWF